MLGLIKIIIRAWIYFSGRMEKAAAARERYGILREPADGPGSPEVIVLKDYESGVDAAVAPSQSGGLASFRARYRGLPVELMYRARNYSEGEGPQGKTAFLCPMAPQQTQGESANSAAAIDGGVQPIAWHELTKDLIWKEGWQGVDTEGANLILELQDSDQTRVRYPFGFVIRAAYELGKGRLTITYTVSAAAGNRGPMPFCLGNRIAFQVPFLSGTEPGAMLFQTSGVGTTFAERSRLGDFESADGVAVSAPEGVSTATLIDPQGVSVRVSQYATGEAGASGTRFSILGGPRLGYLCPQPWYGNPDSADWKDAVVMLRPGQDFHWMLELKPEVALMLPPME